MIYRSTLNLILSEPRLEQIVSFNFDFNRNMPVRTLRLLLYYKRRM